MPRQSSLSVARSHILEHFRCSTRKIFKQSELAGILEQHRAEWQLAASTSLQDFARFLINEGELQEVTLGSEHYINKKAQRFSWGVPSPYELALSLRSGAYLCHATAMFMHGLTDATAHTVYVNLEQSPKPAPSGNLTAASIKAAFARKQRESQLSYRRGEWTLVVVNGKNTGRLGVTSMRGPSDARLDATNLERTLIDIAVRPSYAGNIAHV